MGQVFCLHTVLRWYSFFCALWFSYADSPCEVLRDVSAKKSKFGHPLHSVSSNVWEQVPLSVSWSWWSSPLFLEVLRVRLVLEQHSDSSLTSPLYADWLLFWISPTKVLSSTVLIILGLVCSRGVERVKEHTTSQCTSVRVGEWWVLSLTVCGCSVRHSLIRLHACWLTPTWSHLATILLGEVPLNAQLNFTNGILTNATGCSRWVGAVWRDVVMDTLIMCLCRHYLGTSQGTMLQCGWEPQVFGSLLPL